MKSKLKDVIKITVPLILLGVLFGFTSARNSKRRVGEIYVKIYDKGYPLITQGMVKKLLIETLKKSSDKTLERIYLSRLEGVLKSTGLLDKVDVFLSVNGDVHVQARQRVPILRVSSEKPFYIDSLGYKMPFSDIYSPRLPIYWGWNRSTSLSEVHQLARKIHDDYLLSKNIVSCWKENNEYMMKMRHYDVDICLGTIQDLNEKILNFKAFYQRALEEKKFNQYNRVSLKYKGQVVCKKK